MAPSRPTYASSVGGAFAPPSSVALGRTRRGQVGVAEKADNLIDRLPPAWWLVAFIALMIASLRAAGREQ
jgi:hypothetical protein